MSAKDDMLKRVRSALGRPPTAVSSTRRHDCDELPELGPVLAPVPPGELVSKFEAEFQKVSGQAHHASSLLEMDQILRDILAACGPGPAMFSRNPILGRLDLPERVKALGRPVKEWLHDRDITAQQGEQFRSECFSSSVGFTGVEFALAESGSLVLSSLTEGSQLTSLAPPVHVAVFRRNQVVETLEEVLVSISGELGASMPGRSVVFVTGSSRTADIEQITIHGVHGPTQVHAILAEDACFSYPTL
ncbi:MAG: LutC/YkgG family protein [Terriglobia bacterium]